MTNTEEDKETYPHLLFDKYIPEGKTLCTKLMVLSAISILLTIFIRTSPYIPVFISIADMLNVLVFAALLLIFRHYLLNFELGNVRTAVLIYVIYSLVSIAADRILLYGYLSHADLTPTMGDYAVADIVDMVFVTADNIIFIALYVYIGISLYRYKDDFVGGLQPLGQVFLVMATTCIISFTLSVLMETFVGSTISFPQATSFLVTAAYIYLLYVMRFTFGSAEKYIEDSE